MSDDAEQLNSEQIFWFVTTAYIGRVAGLLNPVMEQRINAMFQDKSPVTWIEQVEQGLGIDADFVRGIYLLCTQKNTPEAAIGFILRGLGCPSEEVDARIRELRVLRSGTNGH